MASRAHRLTDRFSGNHGTDRKPAAKPFGQDDQIRLDIFILKGKHPACPAHAALHFICNHKCPKLVSRRLHTGKIAFRCRAGPAFTLNRFNHNRSDIITQRIT